MSKRIQKQIQKIIKTTHQSNDLNQQYNYRTSGNWKINCAIQSKNKKWYGIDYIYIYIYIWSIERHRNKQFNNQKASFDTEWYANSARLTTYRFIYLPSIMTCYQTVNSSWILTLNTHLCLSLLNRLWPFIYAQLKAIFIIRNDTRQCKMRKSYIDVVESSFTISNFNAETSNS